MTQHVTYFCQYCALFTKIGSCGFFINKSVSLAFTSYNINVFRTQQSKAVLIGYAIVVNLSKITEPRKKCKS